MYELELFYDLIKMIFNEQFWKQNRVEHCYKKNNVPPAPKKVVRFGLGQVRDELLTDLLEFHGEFESDSHGCTSGSDVNGSEDETLTNDFLRARLNWYVSANDLRKLDSWKRVEHHAWNNACIQALFHALHVEMFHAFHLLELNSKLITTIWTI